MEMRAPAGAVVVAGWDWRGSLIGVWPPSPAEPYAEGTAGVWWRLLVAGGNERPGGGQPRPLCSSRNCNFF